MDQQQSQQPEQPQQVFEIWEFVTCAKCQLAFSSDGASGPSVPFWITECGHVLCNSHLNADQSCPSCNAQRIELMPLQKDMPPPFSDWFCSLPFKLDALAQAAKFQHERLVGAARYYKSRYEQYRAALSQLKPGIAEIKTLRKENEALRSENARLRDEWTDNPQQKHQKQDNQYQQEPISYVNASRKRPRIDDRLPTSSPRSIHTPIGPPRITLPPNHEPPPSLSRLNTAQNPHVANGQRQAPSGSRSMQPPGTSQFVQQYAYNPPQSSQMQIPQQVLSYEQQAPVRQQMQQNERRLMPPPPTPMGQVRQIQRIPTPRVPEQMQFVQNQPGMHVPRLRQDGQQQSFSQSSGADQPQLVGQAPRRFVPPGANAMSALSNPQRVVPATPSGGPRRFMPQTPNVGDGRRFVPRATSGAQQLRGP